MVNTSSTNYWGEPPVHQQHLFDQSVQQQTYAPVSHPHLHHHQNTQGHAQAQSQPQAHSQHQPRAQQHQQLQLEHHMQYNMVDGGVTMMNGGHQTHSVLHAHAMQPHHMLPQHQHQHHSQLPSPPIPAAAPPRTASGMATSLADERGIPYAAPADAFVFGPGNGRVVHPATMAGEHPSAFPLQFPDSNTGNTSSAVPGPSSSSAAGSTRGGGGVFNSAFSFSTPVAAGGGPSGTDTSIAPHQQSQSQSQAHQQQTSAQQLLHPNYTSPTSPPPPHGAYTVSQQQQQQQHAPKRRRPDEATHGTPPSHMISNVGASTSNAGEESDGEDGYEDFGNETYGVMGMQGYGQAGGYSQAGVGGGAPGMVGNVYGQPGAGVGPQGVDQGEQKRLGGACTRCRSLKVRCEFTSDPNKCRRCLNGGHECLIPGRKKRRQPPKREVLMSQIRDQAQEIDRLMKMLELAGRTAQGQGQDTLVAPKTEPGLNSLLSPTTSPLTADVNHPPSTSSQTVPLPDVQAWIAHARESIQGVVDGLGAAFQGEINTHGAFGALRDDVSGGVDGEDGDDEGDEDGYDILVENSEDDGFGGEDGDGVIVQEPDDSVLSNAGESDNGLNSQYTQTPRVSPSIRSSSLRAGTISREPSLQPSVSGSATGKDRSGAKSSPVAITKPAQPLPKSAATPFGLISQMGRVLVQRPRSPGAHSQGKSSRASSAEPMSGVGTGGAEFVSDSAGAPTSPGRNTDEAHASMHVVGDSAPMSSAFGTVGSNDNGNASDEVGYGAATRGFFDARRDSVPDPSKLAPARHPEPFILTRAIVTPAEVEDLFEIYFSYMNLSCSLLDPVLYTAKKTYWRSPFLFTVICAIASRFYPNARKGLYEQLMSYAQLAAGTALISGPKNVETVSAYILLSLYPVPMRRWEEDRTWLYLGLAIRVATDINLHHPNTARPHSEHHAREILNRTRVWLNCHNLDRSTASWHGKSSTIANTDYIATHSGDWYKQSQFNIPNFDVHLSCYNAELRVLAEFKKEIYSDPSHPTGLNRSLDITKLASETDEKLCNMKAEWDVRLKENVDPSDPQGRFRSCLIGLAYSYARLVVLSFGFQYAIGKGREDELEFFNRCYNAALDIVKVFNEDLSSQKVYLRHGPEAQSVFVTFASAFLIKLLHPRYAQHLTLEQRREIRTSVESIINLLSSDEVVNDERHGPKLWSNFLSALLATPMAKVELSPSAMKGGKSLPRRSKKSHRLSGGAAGPGSPASSGSPASPSPSAAGDINESTGAVSTPSPSGNSATLSPPPPTHQQVITEHDSYRPASGQLPPLGYDHNMAAYTTTSHSYNMDVHAAQPTKKRVSFNTGVGPIVTPIQTSELHNALQMDFFQPPLAFDTDFLQSMNTMEDPTVWQNMPGFNWMNVLHNGNDVDMQIDLMESFNPQSGVQQQFGLPPN